MTNLRTTRGRAARRLRPGRSVALVLMGVIVASALWVVVAAAASADPPPVDCSNDIGDQCRKLVPVLTCIWPNANGTVAAVFGYANSSSHPISVSIGSNNEFVPAPVNRGQPTSFPAGATVANAFVVTYSGGWLTWQLTGHTVTATWSSTRCAQNPVPMIGDWRALAVAVALCAPIGYVAYRRLRPRWAGFSWALASDDQPRSK